MLRPARCTKATTVAGLELLKQTFFTKGPKSESSNSGKFYILSIQPSQVITVR